MREHSGARSTLASVLVTSCLLVSYCSCYLIVVHENAPAGEIVFNASVHRLGSDRTYTINAHKSASYVHRIIHVGHETGAVRLKKQLSCDGLYYPTLFTFYVDSVSSRVRNIDYYSLPLRILITGTDCSDGYFDLSGRIIGDETDQEIRRKRDTSHSLAHPVLETAHQYLLHSIQRQKLLRMKRSIHFLTASKIQKRIQEAKRWISETYASFAIPTTDKSWQMICLRKSQFINSLASFMPKTVDQYCKVTFLDLNDDRFAVETQNFHLVARDDVCIYESLWKVVILFKLKCEGVNMIDTEHRLKIVYHHQEFNDTDIARRVRRELRNQSPFFEQALYVASVMEEQTPPASVTTLKARDPEGSSIVYSMTSLLDSRSQGMFQIDSHSGSVVTMTQLDRELVDVHYFRVLATDDSFPPRSGTTTLQINVLDCNDHAPAFESSEFHASVRESASAGSTVVTLRATDQDVGKNAEIEYGIESVSGETFFVDPTDANSQPFRIDAQNGVLSVRSQLDRERVDSYSVVVTAKDLAHPASARKTSTATVLVNVLDDNDNYPQFGERTYTVHIKEDSGNDNPVIARVAATDADTGVNAAIRYAIIGGNTMSQFSIDSMTGQVSLVKPLDYEATRSYRLVVRAQDGGSPSRSNTTQLLINVVDVNDNSPRFYAQLFQEAVLESVPPGYNIVRVQAYDADEGDNAEITYSIVDADFSLGQNSNEEQTEGTVNPNDFPLTVDPRTGWVHTTMALDREKQSKYQFQVLAKDHGNPSRSASASVLITVQDVNDNDPTFNPKHYDAALAEDEVPGTPVVQVIATDPDEDSRLHYEISSGNTRGRFAITSQNGYGLITVAQQLDYKQERRFILTITATDSGGRTDTATVYVNITDANNFAPVFENAPYSTSVFEDAPLGTTVLVVSATDGDVGLNAELTYTLSEDSSGPQPFKVIEQTGAIVTNNLLDRETTSSYLLTVTAQDGGNPALSDTTDIEISVSDVNDNKPVFAAPMYLASVPENALVGTSVIQVSATDLDIGMNGRIRYALVEKDVEDGSFVIDASSGVIRTNKGLDRESVSVYHLQAVAKDLGTPSLSSTAEVQVRIEDVNDNPPTFASNRISLYIPENSPVGSLVGVLHAQDPDEGVNAIIHYSIIGGEDSNSFSLMTRPGSDLAELLTMVDMDYESSKKKFELVVRAASPPLRNDVHVDIIVTDVNDNAPVLKDFQVIVNNYKDYFPSGPIGRIPAFDADVTDKLNYKILSGNNAHLLTLNQTSGELTLSPQLNTNVPRQASMEVAVSDGVNDVKSIMTMTVRLVTEDMLLNSVTIRLNDMTSEAFLSPLMNYFIDGLAAIIPCPREHVFILSVHDDTDVNSRILNVSFSAGRLDMPHMSFYKPQYLQERVYLHRMLLQSISTVQVLPFDDNLCVHEPCLNFEQCVTVLKFGNASGFITSDTVLFRSIYPVTTFSCRCPEGFTGSREHYLCDTEVNLCYSNPCKNAGACIRREGGYTCICKMPYTGVNCETILNNCTENNCLTQRNCLMESDLDTECEKCPKIKNREQVTLITPAAYSMEHNKHFDSHNEFSPMCELRSRSFVRGSYLTFPSLHQRNRLQIKLRFATLEPNSLLLYNGRYNNMNDYIALEIIDGAVQFSFSLGDGAASVVTNVPGGVSDGMWHSVEVEYFNKSAILSVDDCDSALALSPEMETKGIDLMCANFTTLELPGKCVILTETCHRFLDLTGPLQIGGLPNLPGSLQVNSRDFVGCISDLHIDNRFIDLNSFVADNATVLGCPELSNFCSSDPCQNGGTCIERWGSHHCLCLEGFTGKDCNEITTPPWRFQGDGLLSFNPLLRPIQLPWLNALSVRTRQSNAFLMSIQLGQNSKAILSLKDGVLQYTYNNDPVYLLGVNLSDGMWHRIEMQWLGTELAVSLDYNHRVAIFPVTYKIQGLYVGKIVLGMDSGVFGNFDYGYFVGCIQDVRVGNLQSVLNRPTVQENVQEGCSSQAECPINCPENSKCNIEWDEAECVCKKGFIGNQCISKCDVNPCLNGATCHTDYTLDKAYYCSCNSTLFSGEYCEIVLEQPCPAGWWGVGECGPCKCDVDKGYNPDCHKSTGECTCNENHYQPEDQNACLPCNCYSTGSFSSACDKITGQCSCRDGVIGRRCDTCPNPYAEITLKGCEVVYDSCPRALGSDLWWPRTSFGSLAIISCPNPASGRASRLCDSALGGWQQPDLFNCTSKPFIELRKQLSQLEHNELTLNTFVAVKLAEDLRNACSLYSLSKDSNNYYHQTSDHRLYGADILISEGILQFLIAYELNQSGLNLSHSQDKDYIQNIVLVASTILDLRYEKEWHRIAKLTGRNVDSLVRLMHRYINTLARNQHDTYTSPFEITQLNLVLGLDIVTAESLFGYEPHYNTDYLLKTSKLKTMNATNKLMVHDNKYSSSNNQPKTHQSYTTERVVLPDTSSFLFPYEIYGKKKPSRMISFPKYNNFMLSPDKFDKWTKVMVPLDVLGITQPDEGEITVQSLTRPRTVLSYVQYKQAGLMFPERYDYTVSRRWGVDMIVASPIISITILIPGYHHEEPSSPENVETDKSNSQDSHIQIIINEESANHSTNHNNNHNIVINEMDSLTNSLNNPRSYSAQLKDDSSSSQLDMKNMYDKRLTYNADNKNADNHVNDVNIKSPQALPLIENQDNDAKLVYKPIGGLDLKQPIRLQMWLNLDNIQFIPRANPQCVHWRVTNGEGAWSRIGCQTELPQEITYQKLRYHSRNGQDGRSNQVVINCSCTQLSTYAVLVDVIDPKEIPEPSLLQNISHYLSFSIALILLLIVIIAFGLLRGPQTNSIRIHTNLVLCVFIAEFLYFIALQSGRSLIEFEFPCKLLAMWLHYFWLATFCWSLVDMLHLYRMLTEMRDINHGPMCIYYGLGYASPAIITGLSVGVRAHQYGNNIFCWLSIFESVIWWLAAPICFTVAISLIVLFLSMKAAFTLKEHVLGFGNLRTLLWLSVVSLPLLVIIWVLALLTSSDREPTLGYLLDISVLVHGIFSLVGYCIINQRVKENVHRTILHCMDRKLPLLESSSSQSHIGGAGRAPVSLTSGGIGSDLPRRHIGISASSTTSRSTTKTSSSPYSRSDGHLRSTSTSNSTSDVPSYLKRYETNLHRHKEEKGSDSDSDSEGRSLDLASSYSSDDEESSNRRHRHKGTNMLHNYLPNITEVQSPPDLHVMNSPQLFPSVQPNPQYMKPIYAPKWSSQLPESYLPYNKGRWSQDTGSDNEVQPNLVQTTLNQTNVTHSPNPLPNPDLTLDTNHARKVNSASPNMNQYDHESQYGKNMGGHNGGDCGKYEEIQNGPPQVPEFINKNYDKVKYGQSDYEYDDQRSPYADSKEMYDQQDSQLEQQNMQYRSNDQMQDHDNSYNPKDNEYSMKSNNYLKNHSGLNVGHNQYLAYSNSDNVYTCNQDMTNTFGTDYPDITDRISVNSEKYNICDKYLFPYTAEEDHSSPTLSSYMPNPGISDYQNRIISRNGSRRGSLGTNHTSSPLPTSYSHTLNSTPQVIAPLTNITDTEEKNMDETPV